MYVASSSYIYIYTVYLYTHRSEEAKRKQSEQRRLQRKRNQKILDENAAYGPPDKGHYFDNEITAGKRKEKLALQKSYPCRVNNRMSKKKHLLLVLQ